MFSIGLLFNSRRDDGWVRDACLMKAMVMMMRNDMRRKATGHQTAKKERGKLALLPSEKKESTSAAFSGFWTLLDLNLYFPHEHQG